MTKEKITDFGVKIGGAKKDNYLKNGGITYEDLKDLHQLELPKLIVKDNIWIKPDYKKMLDEGYDAVTLYYLKNIRDALPAKPLRYEDKYLKRYMDLLFIYKKLSGAIKTIRDIPYALDTLRSIANEMDYSYLRSGDHQKAYNVVDISKSELLELFYEVAILNFPHEFNGKLKGLSIRQRGDNSFTIIKNGKILSSIRSGETTYRFEYQHTTKESAMKVIHEEIIPCLLDKKLARKEREYRKYTRPQLEGIKRIGPYYRRGINITGEMILKYFNLRAGEFGNWNTESDKQAYLNYYFESTCDLMDVLKAPLHFTGLGFETEDDRDTRLAIAFGARGQSAALAHYEPAFIVINLTKMKGAGSLAHEMGHAIDHFIGESCGFKHSLYTKSGLNRYNFRSKDAVILYPELQESFCRVMDIMMKKDCTDEEMIEIHKKSLDTCIPNVKSWLSGIENVSIRIKKQESRDLTDEEKQKIIDAKEQVINDMTFESIENLETVYKTVTKIKLKKTIRDSIKAMIESHKKDLETCTPKVKSKLEGIENVSIKIEKRDWRSLTDEEKQQIIDAKEQVINDMTFESIENLETVYKKITKRLPSKDRRDSLKILVSRYNGLVKTIKEIQEDKIVKYRYTKDTKYYEKSKEMDKLVNSCYLQDKAELFARAFECYVEDQLKKMGRRSDYLVHSTSNDSYDNYKPYPSGEERELINSEMEKFLKIFVSTFSVYLENTEDDRNLLGLPEVENDNPIDFDTSNDKKEENEIYVDSTIEEAQLSDDEIIIKDTLKSILQKLRF